MPARVPDPSEYRRNARYRGRRPLKVSDIKHFPPPSVMDNSKENSSGDGQGRKGRQKGIGVDDYLFNCDSPSRRSGRGNGGKQKAAEIEADEDLSAYNRLVARNQVYLTEEQKATEIEHGQALSEYDGLAARRKRDVQKATGVDHDETLPIRDTPARLRKRRDIKGKQKATEADYENTDSTLLDTLSQFPLPPSTTRLEELAKELVLFPSQKDLIIHAPEPRYDDWAAEYAESLKTNLTRQPTRERASSNVSFSRPTRAAYPSITQVSTPTRHRRDRAQTPIESFKTPHRKLSLQSTNTAPVPYTFTPPLLVNAPAPKNPMVQKSSAQKSYKAVVHNQPAPTLPDYSLYHPVVASALQTQPRGPRSQGVPSNTVQPLRPIRKSQRV